MKRLIRITMLLTIISLFFIYLSSTVSAQTNHENIKIPNQSKTTFMLMPELPKDNIGGKKIGYFNLKLQPGKKRSIRVKVFNPTNKKLTIYGRVTDATTNDNADIDYLGNNQVDSKLLKAKGSKLINLPTKTNLMPNETKWIKIRINTPKQLFKGQKATAINLSTNQVTSDTSIKNHYVYAIGLVLNGHKLHSDKYKHINSSNIKTRFVKQHKAAISVKINNPDPIYLKHATIKIILQNKKWHFIKYKDEKNSRKIAPNSSFYEDIPLKGKRLVSGVYEMSLLVKSPGNTRKIIKYVQIDKNQAMYINRYNYEYLKNRNLIIIAILITFTIISVIILYIKNRNE